MSENKISLGQKVVDTLSGFEGFVTCRAEYLDGLVRFEVTPKMIDGKVNTEWFDEKRLAAIPTDQTV